MNCLNHPDRAASWFCPTCNVYYCSDCADAKMFGAVRVDICPRCKDKVFRIEQYRPSTPFWERIPDILRYPLKEEGWMRLLALGGFALVFLGLARIGMVVGGMFGFMGAMSLYGMYYGIVYSYFYKVISRSETGELVPPDWSDFSGVGTGFFWPATQFMMTSAVVFMPILIFIFITLGFYGFDTNATVDFLFKSAMGLIMIVLLGLVGLAILPMGLLLLGVFRTVKNAWNPLILFSQIMKIPREYLAALGFMCVIIVAYVLVKMFFYFILVGLKVDAFITAWLISMIVQNIIMFYFLVVTGHLLGYMAYQCRFELGWWPETRNRPILDRAPAYGATAAPVYSSGRVASAADGLAHGVAAATMLGAGASAIETGLSRPATVSPTGQTGQMDLAVQEGLRLMESGALDQAKDYFLMIVQNNPQHLMALTKLTEIAVRQKDRAAVDQHGKNLLELLIKIQEQAKTLEIYQLIRGVFPDITLSPKSHITLAKWLQLKELFMEAAAAYRQFAVTYPNDGMAPKALYTCGEILWKKANNAQAARQMFDYLLKRYPNSDLVDFVKQALAQIPGA